MTVLIDIQKSEFLFDVKNIDVFQSCVVNSPDEIDPTNPSDPDPEEPLVENWVPLPPELEVVNLPIIPAIVDTSPNQMIGCISSVGDNPQGRLAALFPLAVDGDGVVERETNDIWTFDGSLWNNVGPTPGPTLSVDGVIPPWHETIPINIKNRCRVQVGKFPYAFSLLSEPDPLTVFVQCIPSITLPVLAAFEFLAPQPLVEIDGIINVPPSGLFFAPQSVDINPGARIFPSTVSVVGKGEVPVGVNSANVFAKIKPAAILFSGHSLSVSTGATLIAPLSSIQLNSLPPSVRDPYYDNVALLLQLDGKNGAQYLLDTGPSRSTDIFDFFRGKARLSSYRKKFGTASMLFPKDIVQESNFDVSPGTIALGSSDFTIELFFYPENVSGTPQSIVNDYRPSRSDGRGWRIEINSNSSLFATASSDGINDDFVVNGGPVVFWEWNHVAFVRKGTSLMLFLNGVLRDSVFIDQAIYSRPNYLTFATDGDGNNPFSGYVDSARITVGVARYESDFTVPSVAFWDHLFIPPSIVIESPIDIGATFNAPTILTGASVSVPVSTIGTDLSVPEIYLINEVEIPAPAVIAISSGIVSVNSPAIPVGQVSLSLNSPEPIGIGSGAFIAMPETTIASAIESVAVTSGASAAIQATAITTAAATPELFRNQIAYTIPGTYSFEVPSYTTSVCVVAIGGGGGSAGCPGGSAISAGGGGGGALAYVNNIAVTPGESLTVVVGSGGAGGATTTSDGSSGGESALLRGGTYLCHATGGEGGFRNGDFSRGGDPLVTEGPDGYGGYGGAGTLNQGGGGGGGAGGYSGYGGDGGETNTGSGTNGTGGSGGGGGGQQAGGAPNNAGGGVGIFGEGSNGIGGAPNNPGTGGSGGGTGRAGGLGGLYGGGGGGAEDDTARVGSAGGGGAVRIIWGTGRAFPSTNTQDI